MPVRRIEMETTLDPVIPCRVAQIIIRLNLEPIVLIVLLILPPGIDRMIAVAVSAAVAGLTAAVSAEVVTLAVLPVVTLAVLPVVVLEEETFDERKSGKE